ncbi:MAG TPA: hypothetical protein VJ855_06015 [Marinilabiliaceae bacterium]|nr:hypothetical protein [Marinilabiliaceae bacterium]
MMRLIKIGIVLLVIAASFGCERDYMFRGGTDGIKFSSDTVMFDTIFTSIGSATRHFRVYNPYSADMIIDRIQLMGGDDSKFRINVDGRAEYEVNDVELRSGDSLFVFVEVRIDPGLDANTPFVVTDSITFYTKERFQTVKLIAYGQDVVILRDTILKTTRFTKDKPYLIYDRVEVDSLEKLTIEAGSRLHFYKDAFLNVRPGATLEVLGTKEEPVLFAGSRLESWYADIPGQWGYIYLMPGSKNNSFNYANIRNATIGLVLDSVGLDSDPVIISNTRIEHSSKQGLLAQSSSILSWNSLFADSGSASVALMGGGNYNFFHCTIANYFTWKVRGVPAVVLSNFFEGKNGIKEPRDLQAANFKNCIIYGQASDELALYFYEGEVDSDSEEEQIPPADNYKFDHVLLRSQLDDNILTDKKHFNDVIVNKSPFFMNYKNYDYSLDTLSVAQKAGSKSFAQEYPFDYDGNNRLLDGKQPDLGFLERVEGQ